MTTKTPEPMKLDIISEMALKDWRSLNAVLSALREDQLAAMLIRERADRKRMDMAVRIHQRFCQVRSARERSEVMTDCEKTS